MANEQNLRPGEYKLTLEEQKKGGIASGKARAEKRDLRKALEDMLDRDYQNPETNEIFSGTQILAMSLFRKAKKGDVRAFEALRDTIGQKPIDKVMIAEVDPAVIDEVERAVFDVDESAGT